ncbi:MAG: hypothetical protein XD52_1538, partial [bacterium 42_11]
MKKLALVVVMFLCVGGVAFAEDTIKIGFFAPLT